MYIYLDRPHHGWSYCVYVADYAFDSPFSPFSLRPPVYGRFPSRATVLEDELRAWEGDDLI